MRIAIYGAGSLGTILGAFISKAGIPIELINRNKAHVEALKNNGAHLAVNALAERLSLDQRVRERHAGDTL